VRHSILSFPTLPNVNTLSLFNTNFETFTQALNLICSFPELHDLSLDEVTWFHRYDRIPQVPSHLPSSVPTLQSLTLNRCPKVDLLNWLLCQDETHAHIHTLHMDGISALETVAIAKFLPRLARSLQHLHFGYTQHADGISLSFFSSNHLITLSSRVLTSRCFTIHSH
jgi:hypothetical protein